MSKIKLTGSNSGYVEISSAADAGNLTLALPTSGTRLLSNGDNVYTGITTFTNDIKFEGGSYDVLWDASDNQLEFEDNAKLSFGASSDLQIFHDGNHSFIQEQGYGSLVLKSNQINLYNAAGDQPMVVANQASSVDIFFANSKKLETTNTGVNISGICTATEYRGGGNSGLIITSDGDIYGPSGGRKNWFDNGSFDCTYGGRKNNVSMDYGNHHAYGWVTDRFQSRNSVQWSRSTNVPTGKGFSYSTLTNGAGGQLVQAVELPDYGDMGVFTPGSYWCVSFWSTAGCNPAGAAFSYDLGSTKTDIPTVGSGGYASTGETAAGTSTGTFTRYFRVFGPMPNSIISGAIAAYWQWGFSAAGYTTGFQLERVPTSTSKPTPYEHVHPSVTIARCRRYAYRVYNSRHVTGWKRHDSNINWEARHPVLPTHMPSGSNQSADPYGVALITAGTLTNFQSVWQNPAVTSLGRYGFNPADGSFILYGTSGYSGTHLVIPSWEGFEYEIGHGFF